MVLRQKLRQKKAEFQSRRERSLIAKVSRESRNRL